MTNKMHQNIILELSDGRLIRATVPAFCHIGDRVSVRDIRVTNPEKLPEDCSFEDNDDDMNEAPAIKVNVIVSRLKGK